MSFVDIPEILDELLQFFDTDDIRQHRVFKEVCRSFLHAVRRRTWTFRHVRARSEDAVVSLVDLLSSRVQTMLLHVRTIVLSGGDAPLRPNSPASDVTIVLRQCLNLLDANLHNVLIAVNKLDRMNLLASLRLDQVQLLPSCSILDVLKLCPSIRRLSLVRQESVPIGLVAVLVPGNIETLELDFDPCRTSSDSSTHLLTWLASHPGYVPYLRRFTMLNVGVSQVDVVEKFLCHDLPVLDRLCVFVGDEDQLTSDRLRYNVAFVKRNSLFRDGFGQELYHYGRRTISLIENM